MHLFAFALENLVAQLITASRLTAFRRCGRYHALRYDQRLLPVQDRAGARRWGSAMHRALEAWWLAMQRGDTDALDQAILALDPAGELDEVERTRAVASMCGYHFRWLEQGLEILAVEAQFDAPLVNPDSLAASRLFTVGGKIDAIVRNPADGQVWLVEHKTAGGDISPGSPYWQRLRLDVQVSTYMDGARALGYEPAGCIYDVIARPGEQLRLATPVEARKYTKGKGCKPCGGTAGGKDGPKKGLGYDPNETIDVVGGHPVCEHCEGSGWAEAPRLYEKQRETDETLPELAERITASIAAAPDEYYMRSHVVRTAEEMVDARREMWASAKLLRIAQREGLDLRNPDACFKFGSPCEYLPICDRTAEPTDTTRFRIADTAHPELAGV